VTWAIASILTVVVVIYVGYPLFGRQPSPAAPEVDDLELAIARRRGKKQSVAPRAGVICASCGERNLPQDRFCARCGAALGLRCPACGTKYEAGDRFCAGCGSRLAGRY